MYGRQQAIGLVREFMERPESDGLPDSRRVPVVLFTGPRGSGKTALLTELKNRLDGNVPYSCIDCGSFDASHPWNVLTRLVFDFNLSAAKYRKVPFARFVAARVVIEENLDLNHLPTAEQQVKNALARYRKAGQLRVFLTGLAEELAAAGPGLGGVPGADGAGRKIADGVSNALLSWQVLHDEGVTWFGPGQAGIRRLVELNRLTRSANEEDKQEATKRLWAAFLADLRAAFGTGRGVRAWSLNCVVLLDDADSGRGVLLLRELTQARRQHAVNHPGEPDPLTVVATARPDAHRAGRAARCRRGGRLRGLRKPNGSGQRVVLPGRHA